MGDITVRGGFGGSPLYVAPEQITKYRWVNPSTDVFELAATFYHVVTGVPVWELAKGEEPIRAILEGTIKPIRQHNAKISRRFAAIIDQALARDPKARFPSAVEMKAAMEAAFHL